MSSVYLKYILKTYVREKLLNKKYGCVHVTTGFTFVSGKFNSDVSYQINTGH